MYLPVYQSVYQSFLQRSTSYCFQSPQSPVYASSDVQFLCHITHSTSISHFTSSPARLRLPASEQAICHAPCALTVRIISTRYSTFRTKSSNYVISYFQILSVLAVFLQSSIPVLNNFALTRSPMNKFPKRNSKHFLPLSQNAP
jgi:hypothetical protein